MEGDGADTDSNKTEVDNCSAVEGGIFWKRLLKMYAHRIRIMLTGTDINLLILS